MKKIIPSTHSIEENNFRIINCIQKELIMLENKLLFHAQRIRNVKNYFLQ